MRRFMVIEHDWLDKQKRVCVHDLLGNYHWHSIDDVHILLLGQVNATCIPQLNLCPEVLLMPSLWSTKILSVHAAERGRHAHYLSLNKHLGIQQHHKIVDLAEAALEAYGHSFALHE